MESNTNMTHIYENVNGVIYRRDFGAQNRKIIGYESLTAYNRANGLDDAALWQDICQTAKTNQALQSELNRVIMFYRLIKESQEDGK